MHGTGPTAARTATGRTRDGCADVKRVRRAGKSLSSSRLPARANGDLGRTMRMYVSLSTCNYCEYLSLFIIALLLHSVGQTILDSTRPSRSPGPPPQPFTSTTTRIGGAPACLICPYSSLPNLRIRSGHRAGDKRFAATARFCCTPTHDRQKLPWSEPHRYRHVAERLKLYEKTHHSIGQFGSKHY